MTTVISRLYAEEETAKAIALALKERGFGEDTIDVFPGTGPVTAPDIAAARVAKKDAQTYADALKPGNAVLVVRAPFTPFGAARLAIATMDQVDTIPVAIRYPNLYIRETTKHDIPRSLFKSHPLFLTRRPEHRAGDHPGLLRRFFHLIGLRSVSTSHRTTRSASSGWYVSTRLWPLPQSKP